MGFAMTNKLSIIHAALVSHVWPVGVALVLVCPLAAHGQHPMKPPTQVAAAALNASEPQAPQAPAASKPGSSGISNQQPDIPADQIIKQFAAHEAEFKTERDNFTYTQTFSIQTLDDAGRVDGEYKRTSEVVFTPAGK